MTRRLKIFAIVFILLIGRTNTSLRAQCCAAGNPASADFLQHSTQKNNLLLITAYKYSYSDTYYNFDHIVEVPQIKFSQFNFLSTQFIYGLSKKINVFGELGYFIDKTQVLTIQGGQKFQGKGLGDLLLGARYIAFSKPLEGKQLNVSAGVKLPAGEFDQTNDNIVLPLSLQPSTGTTKFNGSACYTYHKPGKRFGGFILISLEMSSIISSPNFYYKYGNFISTNISGTYKLNDYCSFSLQSRLESRDKDKRASNVKVESTGSKAVFVAPSVQFFFSRNWALTAQLDFPVYKYMNGYQLTNKYGSNVNISKRLIFKSKEKEIK